MKKILSLAVFLFLFINHSHGADIPDNSIYGGLLQEYVQGVKVDLSGLCKDKRLGQYVDALAKADPDKMAMDDQQLAFWINAYNAYNLKAVCDRYPVDSMIKLGTGPLVVQAAFGKTVWDKPIAIIHGKKYTLKNIDHGVIRGRFHDPKIQFALYCGAVSCPSLRNEPYEAARLRSQLTEQAAVFFGNVQWNSFDLKSKTATLSSIMNWNARYFGTDHDAILRFIAGFAPADVRDSLSRETSKWSIKYNSYDLTINDIKRMKN